MSKKIKIIMDNVYARVEGASKKIENVIWNELSFQIEEFQAQNVRRRHLFNRKTKKTYTGLVDYVKRILNEYGEQFEIIDNRVKPKSNGNFKLVDTIKVHGKDIPLKARPYQKEVIDNCEEREVIQAATGAGKTFVMAALIAKFNVKRVAVFADKLSLCSQIKEEFEKFLGVPIGIVGGGMEQREDITVFSVQSATKEDVKDAQMILFDECHHLPSNTMNQVARWAKDAYYRIGVSATPWRDGGDDLLIEAVLRKKKSENAISASKLINLGYLVPPTIYFVPFKQTFKGKNYHKVYEKAIAYNDDRNAAIVKIANKMYKTKDRTTLILIQRVEHGEILKELMEKKIKPEKFTITVEHPKSGEPTMVRISNIEFVSGQDGPLRRKAVIEGAKQKLVKVLIGSTIADEGLDVPALDCLILAGGGKSSTRAYQRIGRVLRNYKNPKTNYTKERAIVFDFVDYTPMLRRHSRIRERLYREEEAWEIKFLNPKLIMD
ncbi:MAG: DEAD/DEAH box helicase [archaeon]